MLKRESEMTSKYDQKSEDKETKALSNEKVQRERGGRKENACKKAQRSGMRHEIESTIGNAQNDYLNGSLNNSMDNKPIDILNNRLENGSVDILNNRLENGSVVGLNNRLENGSVDILNNRLENGSVDILNNRLENGSVDILNGTQSISMNIGLDRVLNTISSESCINLPASDVHSPSYITSLSDARVYGDTFFPSKSRLIDNCSVSHQFCDTESVSKKSLNRKCNKFETIKTIKEELRRRRRKSMEKEDNLKSVSEVCENEGKIYNRYLERGVQIMSSYPERDAPIPNIYPEMGVKMPIVNLKSGVKIFNDRSANSLSTINRIPSVLLGKALSAVGDPFHSRPIHTFNADDFYYSDINIGEDVVAVCNRNINCDSIYSRNCTSFSSDTMYHTSFSDDSMHFHEAKMRSNDLFKQRNHSQHELYDSGRNLIKKRHLLKSRLPIKNKSKRQKQEESRCTIEQTKRVDAIVGICAKDTQIQNSIASLKKEVGVQKDPRFNYAKSDNFMSIFKRKEKADYSQIIKNSFKASNNIVRDSTQDKGFKLFGGLLPETNINKMGAANISNTLVSNNSVSCTTFNERPIPIVGFNSTLINKGGNVFGNGADPKRSSMSSKIFGHSFVHSNMVSNIRPSHTLSSTPFNMTSSNITPSHTLSSTPFNMTSSNITPSHTLSSTPFNMTSSNITPSHALSNITSSNVSYVHNPLISVSPLSNQSEITTYSSKIIHSNIPFLNPIYANNKNENNKTSMSNEKSKNNNKTFNELFKDKISKNNKEGDKKDDAKIEENKEEKKKSCTKTEDRNNNLEESSGVGIETKSETSNINTNKIRSNLQKEARSDDNRLQVETDNRLQVETDNRLQVETDNRIHVEASNHLDSNDTGANGVSKYSQGGIVDHRAVDTVQNIHNTQQNIVPFTNFTLSNQNNIPKQNDINPQEENNTSLNINEEQNNVKKISKDNKCDYKRCSIKITIKTKCRFCKMSYCGVHNIPEEHKCKEMIKWKNEYNGRNKNKLISEMCKGKKM